MEPMELCKRRADRLHSIVFGDIDGNINGLFAKLSSLQPKHHFVFALVVGNLFADVNSTTDEQEEVIQRLVTGKIEVPLPTYFTLGRRALPQSVVLQLEANDGELCANLSILGRKSSMKTAEGFRVVSVSGAYSSESTGEQYLSTYTKDDAENVGKGLEDSDILITSDWPTSVRERSKQVYGGKAPVEVDCLSDLCQRLKPRYYFSTSEAFYEREPFFHPLEGETKSITRFISIAPFGNAAKQKSMYAFSLEPASEVAKILPGECTSSPFLSLNKKRKGATETDGVNSFRYSAGGTRTYEPRERPNKRNRHPPQPQECYFCLSRDAGRHMITSIGDALYMTVAKGPLTTAHTFPSLRFPCHMLIIPVAHQPTLQSMPEPDRKSTIDEMQKYRDGLHEMLIAKSQDDSGRARLGSVTWEISRASGVHLHWQFIPVPVELVENGLVEAAFVREAQNLEYPRFAKDADEVDTAEDGDFFKVRIWSQAASKDLVLPFDQSFRFSLQFGRHVLARLLNLWNRADWRGCAQEEAEESADVQIFRQHFQKFDFSME